MDQDTQAATISKLAEYHGTCDVCGEPIEPGMTLVFEREHEVWVHEDCRSWE